MIAGNGASSNGSTGLVDGRMDVTDPFNVREEINQSFAHIDALLHWLARVSAASSPDVPCNNSPT